MLTVPMAQLEVIAPLDLDELDVAENEGRLAEISPAHQVRVEPRSAG